MQILIAVALTAVAAMQTPSFPARLTRSAPVMVRAVIDGDTIDVATLGRVRLLGIDAPEIGHRYDTDAPFGRDARDRLAALVLRHWVRLEQDSPAVDVYNRHLAYVLREDGIFVNAVLVREGLARVSARLPLARLEELRRAEREAQAFRRGMWGAWPQAKMESERLRAPKVALKTPDRYTAKSEPSGKARKAPAKKRPRRPAR